MNPALRAVALMRWMSAQLVERNPQLARTCFDTAADLEAFERIRAAFREGTCRRCGGEIVNASRGRRRTYCRACRPSTAREIPKKFELERGSET